MKKWLLENKSSFDSLFIEKFSSETPTKISTFKKVDCSYLSLFHSKSLALKKYKEFTHLTLLGSLVNKATGSIRFKVHRDFSQTDEDKKNIPIKIRSTGCSDNICLFLILENKNKFSYFYCHLNLCCVLRNFIAPKEAIFYDRDNIKFHKIDFLTGTNFMSQSEEILEIPYKIFNMKKTEHVFHYCFKNAPPIFPFTFTMNYCFYGIQYKFPLNKCLFCFRCYDSIQSLICHLKRYHTNYIFKIETNNSIDITDSQTNNNNYGGYTLLLKSSDEKMHLKHILKSTDIKNIFFMSYKYHRKNTRKKINIQPHHYRPEIMVDYDVKKYSKNFITYLSGNKLDDLVDVSKKQLQLMKNWNVFVLKQEIKLNLENIRDRVIRFLKVQNDTDEVFNFLIMLFKQCVLSQIDVQIVLMALIDKH